MSDSSHFVDDKENQQQTKQTDDNPIDLIAREMDADRIHLESLRLDKRLNKQDYDFITRLPLTARQIINILYVLYPPIEV